MNSGTAIIGNAFGVALPSLFASQLYRESL